MSFEVDRYSSAWAHIALCADLTWAREPPDEFIIANQRLWAQHCRVSQVLQDSSTESQLALPSSKAESSDKRPFSNQNQENGSCSSRSVKEVIPESRLAQFYGNFYYDDVRENCYTNTNEKNNARGYNGQGYENSDLTECWMLPEVEYWFRKLLDEPADRCYPRRRRQYRMLAEDDSERWGPIGRATGEEAALAARVCSVRALWMSRPRTPSPPPPSRKMRARRRQPRRLLTQSPLTYCLETPAPLLCDPTCKFQFEPPRPPQLSECQRAIGHLSVSVQAVMRASASRCPPYRGTNVSRYAPTSQRPARCPDRRYGVWWPRDHPSPRLENRFRLTQPPDKPKRRDEAKPEPKEVKPETVEEVKEEEVSNSRPESENDLPVTESSQQPTDNTEVASTSQQQDSPPPDVAEPSTSSAADSRKQKRLYSTVLSMSAPPPINLAQVRLSQKLAPGLLKLNPKIVLPAARIRNANVDNKFEELEKEALEQYKGSDESIDTKFRELEKQAVEQYSNSNSNTSCSSGNSAEKKSSPSPTAVATETEEPAKQSPTKFHKEKSVDSVTIYSQNFPDAKGSKNQTTSVTNLKNCHTPQRGEKKEQVHRPCKNARSGKNESQKAASDTDYEAREANFKGSHKGPMRWTLHVVPPKKRHLNLSVSDCSSDDEQTFKDAVPRIAKQNCSTGKTKLSEHGGGDLNILRTT